MCLVYLARGESCAFIGPHISLHDFAIPAFVIQELGGVLSLYNYNGLDDVDSWTEKMQDYGSPSPKGSNPRYRVIIADAESTIDKIISEL